MTGRPAQSSRTRRTWVLVVEIMGVLGGVATIIALVLQLPPFASGSSQSAGSPAPGPGPTTPVTPTSGPTTPGPTTPSPTRSEPSITRHLVDLVPDSGGGYVQRVGARALRMQCGTGNSDDRFRDVVYVVPPAESYRSFATTVAAAGPSGTRVQAILILDNAGSTSVTVPTGRTAPLTATTADIRKVTLRILCDSREDVATFTDPGLAG